MNMVIRLLSLFFLFTAAAIADSPGCYLKGEKVIAFSEDTPTDTLIIEIDGKTCNEAVQYIRIVGKAGSLLYQYSEPLIHAFRTNITRSDAESVVEFVLRDDARDSTTDLPVWRPEKEYYEKHSQQISVSEAYYKRIRNQPWRTFSHQIGYEGRKVIVYDRNQRQAIEVSRGNP